MKLYGGFVDGKLDVIDVDTGWGGFGRQTVPMPALFKYRGNARARYEDVRPIEIKEVRRKSAVRSR